MYSPHEHIDILNIVIMAYYHEIGRVVIMMKDVEPETIAFWQKVGRSFNLQRNDIRERILEQYDYPK